MSRVNEDSRTYDQIRDQYELEKEFANRLKNAGKDERKRLYTALYDEYFRRLPHHPQIKKKNDPAIRHEHINYGINLLKRFLNNKSVYLEIGPGDCALALEVSKFVSKVYAVDVSREISGGSESPDNFRLMISDGTEIPVPENTVDVAFSNQLMEHLHPEDALEQLQNIYRALKSGGKYICITPNRVCGPHDISKYFDSEATGFHLKEYTVTELSHIFKSAGFSKVNRFVSSGGITVTLPIFPANIIERVLCSFSHGVRKRLSEFFPIKVLLGGLNVKLIATK